MHTRRGVSVYSFIRALIPMVCSWELGACAIHPLPENVTGVKTVQIVHRIRCEARDAVVHAANWLSSRNKLKKLQILESTAIVYAFSLEGMESDNFQASTSFVKPLTNSTQTYNPSLGDNLMRQNTRTFTVVDNFSVLYHKMDAKKCETEPTGSNYQYPIVGTIGVHEMINTFINLTLHEDLEEEQQQNITGGSNLDITANGPPTMVDTISFTTTLSAGVTPTIMLTPVTMATQLTMASLGITLSRTDTHQVIVGLALPGPISSLGAPIPISPHPRVGMLISGSPRNPAEANALEAVNDQILRYEVPRPLITTP
jgi:hypothetical protein